MNALLEWLAPAAAHAHVGYVLSDARFDAASGPDSAYLLSVLTDPAFWLISAGVAGTALLAWFAFEKSPLALAERERLEGRSRSYQAYFAWMARLSLGIALIGAGSARALISPALDAGGIIPFIEILAGFFLLAGFLLGPATWAAVALYAFAVIQDPYMVGNMDFLALGVVLLLYGDSRPGADDLLRIPFFGSLHKYKDWMPFVLRVGLGIAMTYLAVTEKLLNPHASELVVEMFRLTEVIPVSAAMWVVGAGLVEALVGILILIGYRTRVVSAIAFIILSFSFFYFGEQVYAHVTLFAALSILFVTGAGSRYALTPTRFKAQPPARH